MQQPQAQYFVGDNPHIQAQRDSHRTGFGGGTLFINAGSFLHAAGPIVVPKKIDITVILKGSTIDLTQATFVHPVTEIQIFALLGGVRVRLPPGVRCETSGLGILGSFKNNTTTQPFTSTAPLVRITGLSILGGAKANVCTETAPLAVVQSVPEVMIETTSEAVPIAAPVMADKLQN
ncbi:hypothetical protein THRCLA_09554 [Thraustotheca clavata]|uniref:Cell wall-active antibiotics response LiaF-like C-terminal domain-containing protein n=1 Tax=Thraustotheca clavata TaxID=74557 RepID=A0A1V9YVU8_9STRA|nr:hypothetical protein THRCLA_09554 [Thraustotheca clavata]